MLLTEIIDPKFRNVKSRSGQNQKINQMVGDTEDDSVEGTVGTGAFGRVMKPKNLPDGQVIKYGKVLFGNPEKDGYLNFLKLLSKSDRMASNPYLPRVYNVKVVDDKQYYAVIEELVDLKDMSEDELKVIGDKAFGDLDQAMRKYQDNMDAVNDNNTGKYSQTPTRKLGENDATEVLPDNTAPMDNQPQQPQQQSMAPRASNKKLTYRYGLSRMLKGVLTNQVPVDAIADPKLKQALMLMKKVVRQGGGRGDLHMGNMMARRGPYGAQLVITDPLA